MNNLGTKMSYLYNLGSKTSLIFNIFKVPCTQFVIKIQYLGIDSDREGLEIKNNLPYI